MADDDWKVLPHEPIEKLSDNLWRVVGALPYGSIRRVMTVVRLADGRLVIHSAIAMDEPAMAELEAWGTPAYLIVPNGFHRLDAPRFKRRYPALKVLAPAGTRKQVAAKLPVDATSEDFGGDASVQVRPLDGIKQSEWVMTVRSRDGVTLVLNDSVFNMSVPRDWFGKLFTTVMRSAPGPRVSRLFKLLAVNDRAAFKRDLETLAATPELVRVIVAHDRLASGPDAAATLREAAGYV